MPFLLSIDLPLFAVFLFRFKLFDFIPIARSLVFETMNDPVVVMDTRCRIVDWNDRAMKTFAPPLGPTPRGQSAELVFAPYEELVRQFAGESDTKVEICVPHEGGATYFNARVIPLRSKSGPLGKVILFQDISNERALIEKLRMMATTDPLTGIFNRRMFLQICEQNLKEARRIGPPWPC